MAKTRKEKGFNESKIDEKTGKKIPFFNLGPKNDWKKFLIIKFKKVSKMLSKRK